MDRYGDDIAGYHREVKRARPLYLELKSLGVELRVEDRLDDARPFEVSIGGLASFSPAHADRIVSRVLENEEGLARVLLGKWDPDLEAIRREGAHR